MHRSGRSEARRVAWVPGRAHTRSSWAARSCKIRPRRAVVRSPHSTPIPAPSNGNITPSRPWSRPCRRRVRQRVPAALDHRETTTDALHLSRIEVYRCRPDGGDHRPRRREQRQTGARADSEADRLAVGASRRGRRGAGDRRTGLSDESIPPVGRPGHAVDRAGSRSARCARHCYALRALTVRELSQRVPAQAHSPRDVGEHVRTYADTVEFILFVHSPGSEQRDFLNHIGHAAVSLAGGGSLPAPVYDRFGPSLDFYNVKGRGRELRWIGYVGARFDLRHVSATARTLRGTLSFVDDEGKHYRFPFDPRRSPSCSNSKSSRATARRCGSRMPRNGSFRSPNIRRCRIERRRPR